MSDSSMVCHLCPRECWIGPGQTGFCQVRTCHDGRLLTANYAQISSIALDPIEKKPLYHFFPGKPILSVGTVGCNLGCRFCQNWQISRENAPTQRLSPGELEELAWNAHCQNDSIGLAYTYSEPGVWYEFLRETMPRVRERGLKNVLVTNGYLQKEPWQELIRWTDAANIDLKGFSDRYYQRLCQGRLQPILDNIAVAASEIHLELTTLIIPGENDGADEIRAMARWIADLDPGIPLHLSRYFPNYKMDLPATPLSVMEQARNVAREYLDFVYLGNVADSGETHCPGCGRILIERAGSPRVVGMERDQCAQCGKHINIAY